MKSFATVTAMGCEMSLTDFGTLKSFPKNCHFVISFACL